MKHTAALLLILLAFGCNSTPVADFLDWVSPSQVRPQAVSPPSAVPTPEIAPMITPPTVPAGPPPIPPQDPPPSSVLKPTPAPLPALQRPPMPPLPGDEVTTPH
jgi:hypothetical protein